MQKRSKKITAVSLGLAILLSLGIAQHQLQEQTMAASTAVVAPSFESGSILAQASSQSLDHWQRDWRSS